MRLWRRSLPLSYGQDMVMLGYPLLTLWVGAMFILALLFPLLFSQYATHLVCLALLASISALALNALTGYLGLISLGTGGFLCAGAFVVAILERELHTPFLLNIVAAGLVSGLLGLLAGLPALRLKGIYLLLSTLAIHFVIVYLCGRYQIMRNHIGGIPLEDPHLLLGIILNSTNKWYYFLLGLLSLLAVGFLNLERTYIGRALLAVRGKEVVAHILGVKVGLYKLLAFALSSALIGVAGGLAASYNHFVAYEEFTIWVSVMYLAMIIIGGLGSVAGAFFGAFVVVYLPFLIHAIVEWLSLPTRVTIYLSAIEQSVFGLVMILFLMLEPQGIVGIWRLKVKPYFELWPFRYRRAISTRR